MPEACLYSFPCTLVASIDILLCRVQMTLNAAISINKGTDFILQLIESECTKATEGWRREFEAQQQYVKTLHAQLLRVQTERDVALADFGKAREEAAWHKERYAAAAQEQTERSDVYWEAEAHRLTAEVQSWKDKHEVALRLRDDAERQLERTRTRFSLTVVPLGPLGAFTEFMFWAGAVARGLTHRHGRVCANASQCIHSRNAMCYASLSLNSPACLVHKLM